MSTTSPAKSVTQTFDNTRILKYPGNHNSDNQNIVYQARRAVKNDEHGQNTLLTRNINAKLVNQNNTSPGEIEQTLRELSQGQQWAGLTDLSEKRAKALAFIFEDKTQRIDPAVRDKILQADLIIDFIKCNPLDFKKKFGSAHWVEGGRTRNFVENTILAGKEENILEWANLLSEKNQKLTDRHWQALEEKNLVKNLSTKVILANDKEPIGRLVTVEDLLSLEDTTGSYTREDEDFGFTKALNAIDKLSTQQLETLLRYPNLELLTPVTKLLPFGTSETHPILKRIFEQTEQRKNISHSAMENFALELLEQNNRSSLLVSQEVFDKLPEDKVKEIAFKVVTSLKASKDKLYSATVLLSKFESRFKDSPETKALATELFKKDFAKPFIDREGKIDISSINLNELRSDELLTEAKGLVNSVNSFTGLRTAGGPNHALQDTKRFEVIMAVLSKKLSSGDKKLQDFVAGLNLALPGYTGFNREVLSTWVRNNRLAVLEKSRENILTEIATKVGTVIAKIDRFTPAIPSPALERVIREINTASKKLGSGQWSDNDSHELEQSLTALENELPLPSREISVPAARATEASVSYRNFRQIFASELV